MGFVLVGPARHKPSCCLRFACGLYSHLTITRARIMRGKSEDSATIAASANIHAELSVRRLLLCMTPDMATPGRSDMAK